MIPFANIAQEEDIKSIGSKNELAFRLMSIQLIKIIGELKTIYEKDKSNHNNYIQIILPFSPENSFFGNDGLL